MQQTGLGGTAVAPARSADLAAAMARRSAAFDVGEDAYWNGTIGADAYMLYRLLVRLCRDQSWCWPGLQWLATRTDVSVGTIKRRLEELEQAQLIARQQRPGGMTARTVVRALAEAIGTAIPGDATPIALDTGTTQETAAFFCASETITNAPADGSAVIPQSMESPTTNGGEVDISPAARLLLLGGVLSPKVRAELNHRSPIEIERCLAIARAQPNIKDPAALAVSLLRSSTARREPQERTFGSRPPHHRVTQRQAVHTRAAAGTSAAPDAVAAARSSSASPYAALWRDVSGTLAYVLDDGVMATWFADAQIALVSEAEAVVVVGNVLARTWIREHAAGELASAFRAVLGRDVVVAVEIA